MPDTITSFHTFTPATKARSAEVNENFSNYRGNLIPINTDTASSSHLTHTLGNTQHRWKTAFLGSLDVSGATSTVAIEVLGDSTDTAGAMLFRIGSVTAARIDPGGFDGAYMKRGSHTLQHQTFTASGTFTVPTGATFLLVLVAGAGGGGGAGGSGGSGGGGAGGNGCLPFTSVIPVSAGDVLSITVGAPGNGGAVAGQSGTAGGDSTISRSGSILARCGGAQGGGGGNSTGAAGVANSTVYGSNGCFNTLAGNGGVGGSDGFGGYDSQYASGGARGTAFGATEGGSGGGGGAGYGAGGQGGDGGTGGVAADSGSNGGYSAGGGGGGGADSASPGAGGVGGGGIVIISWIK